MYELHVRHILTSYTNLKGILLHEFLKELILTFRRLLQGLLYDAQATLEELQGHGMVDPSCLRDKAH
jgi:hypothetical protein